jgi:hypothetical protein
MTQAEKQKELHDKLNRETAALPWKELLRHFASGNVIVVDQELDLIHVAAAISSDDKEAVVGWMQANQVAKVSDEQAQGWLEADLSLWAVVVKPFILVQEKKTLQ